jgi:striatin 1/3/4
VSLDPKNKQMLTKVLGHPQTNLICAGNVDGNITLFDFSSNKITHSLNQAHTTQISSLAFSKTGLQLISGCHDGAIKLWDLRKLGSKPVPLCTVEKAHLPKYDESVTSLLVHPTSPLLISTGADSLVKIYEMFV